MARELIVEVFEDGREEEEGAICGENAHRCRAVRCRAPCLLGVGRHGAMLWGEPERTVVLSCDARAAPPPNKCSSVRRGRWGVRALRRQRAAETSRRRAADDAERRLRAAARNRGATRQGLGGALSPSSNCCHMMFGRTSLPRCMGCAGA